MSNYLVYKSKRLKERTESVKLMKVYLTENHAQKLTKKMRKRLIQHSIGLINGTHSSYVVKHKITGKIIGAAWSLKNGELVASYILPEHRGQGLHAILIERRVEDGAYWTVVKRGNHASEKSFKKLGWVNFIHPIEPQYNVWIDIDRNSVDSIKYWTNETIFPKKKKTA